LALLFDVIDKTPTEDETVLRASRLPSIKLIKRLLLAL